MHWDASVWGPLATIHFAILDYEVAVGNEENCCGGTWNI